MHHPRLLRLLVLTFLLIATGVTLSAAGAGASPPQPSHADGESGPMVRVGTEGTYPPFTFHDPETDELTGYDIEVIEAVAVTHEIRFARDVADQVLFLDGGVIAEQGGAEVLTDPREERTRQFLSRVLEAG